MGGREIPVWRRASGQYLVLRADCLHAVVEGVQHRAIDVEADRRISVELGTQVDTEVRLAPQLPEAHRRQPPEVARIARRDRLREVSDLPGIGLPGTRWRLRGRR